ncbi:MAG: Cytidylate kinase [Opitutia bacterium UBA7350]|nr:MAG: Cytidylate kinase [Opitutae bacterium UBA7350]
MDDHSFIIVAIDGGAATGKSSTARALSERLGFMHVNTGAHYRTLTYALLEAGTDPTRPDQISKQLQTLEVETCLIDLSAQLAVNGKVLNENATRSNEVNAAVSIIAAQPKVRNFLFKYQRDQAELARNKNFPGLVMEGRDIGSVIFPDADFSFFLHADAKTRAMRRAKEGLKDSIAERDQIDSTRETAPLTCPDHAIKIDTGIYSLDTVIDHICQYIDPGKPEQTTP